MSECNVCGQNHPGMKHWVSNWKAYWLLTEHRQPGKRGLTPSQLPASMDELLPPATQAVLDLPLRELLAA